MTRYAHIYDQELQAHEKTRQRLAVANAFIASFREFVRAKGLHHEVLEFLLVRHLGEAEALKILGDDEQSDKAT